jgi:uncharacterized membrane protein YqjE
VIHLRQLGPAFLRHVEAYGQLAGAALHDSALLVKARATLVVIGLVLAIGFVVLAGATLIATGWGSPYRWWVAGGVLGVIALGAAICLARATAAVPRSPHLQALRDEWQKDKDWLGRDRIAGGAESGAAMRLQGVPRSNDGSRSARAPSGA